MAELEAPSIKAWVWLSISFVMMAPPRPATPAARLTVTASMPAASFAFIVMSSPAERCESPVTDAVMSLPMVLTVKEALSPKAPPPAPAARVTILEPDSALTLISE